MIEYQSKFIDTKKNIYFGSTSEWMNYWLNKIMKNRVKPSTWASYESKIRNHIAPFLGNIALRNLERKDILSFIEFLFSNDYSVNMIKTILNILKNSLNYATQNEYIKENPYKNIQIHRLDERKFKH